MNWKIRASITLVVVGVLAAAVWLVRKNLSHPIVTVTLRIAVNPADQLDFVTGRGNSAQFKYLVGKQSGVKPVLAQKLTIKPISHSSLLEARVGVPTRDEARRYVEVFVPTLQDLCGPQAQLALAEQSIH